MLDKRLLTSGFENNQSNYWHCPKCSHGYLKIEKDTFICRETASSERYHTSVNWELTCINYIYSCIFKCSNYDCNERFSSSGVGSVEFIDVEEDDGYQRKIYGDYFQPYYFYPPLQIINISSNVPKNIADKLMKSFELFFCSPSSSANYARSALELILTKLKIPKTTIKNHKRVKLNLHNRIDKLPEKYKALKETLIAIKWIGNEGSHSNEELTKDNVLELYEILEYALNEIFDNKTQNLKKKVKKINKAKGITKS